MTDEERNAGMGRVAKQYSDCLQDILFLRAHLAVVGGFLVEAGETLRAGMVSDQHVDYPPVNEAREDIDKLRQRLEEKARLEKTLTDIGLATLIQR